MDPAPIRRWNPGFIALRWRHLFWGLPLLGLLVGLFMHFIPMIRHTATGIVQPTREPSDVTDRPPFEPADVAHALESDKVLGSVREKLDLPNRWRMDSAKCLRTLRSSITCDQVQFRGNTMVAISVTGRSRAESEAIWNVLVAELKNSFNEARLLQDQGSLAHLARLVEKQQADVKAIREALSESRRTNLSRSGSQMPAPITSAETNILKSDFEKAHASHESLLIEFLIKKQMVRAGYSSDALWVDQAPGTPAPVTLWETLRPLVLHSTIGLGSGMVLAVVLAYLLELLFPRKAPTL